MFPFLKENSSYPLVMEFFSSLEWKLLTNHIYHIFEKIHLEKCAISIYMYTYIFVAIFSVIPSQNRNIWCMCTFLCNVWCSLIIEIQKYTAMLCMYNYMYILLFSHGQISFINTISVDFIYEMLWIL